MTAFLDSIPPYVFWELDARRAALRQQGRTLIDLGIGSPDQPIPEVVLEAMERAVREPQLSGYPYFRIHPAFGAAVAAYLGERAHVRQIRLISSQAWGQQGRVTVQASHTLHR